MSEATIRRPPAGERIRALEVEVSSLKASIADLISKFEDLNSDMNTHKQDTKLSIQSLVNSISVLVENINRRELAEKERAERKLKDAERSVDARFRWFDVARNGILFLFASFGFIAAVRSLIESLFKGTP